MDSRFFFCNEGACNVYHSKYNASLVSYRILKTNIKDRGKIMSDGSTQTVVITLWRCKWFYSNYLILKVFVFFILFIFFSWTLLCDLCRGAVVLLLDYYRITFTWWVPLVDYDMPNFPVSVVTPFLGFCECVCVLLLFSSTSCSFNT